MTTLVIAEHDQHQLKATTLNTLSAALAIGAPITVLVAGDHCDAVAAQLAEIPAVAQVLLADAPCYQHQLAENVALLVAEIGHDYQHILMAASSSGKDLLPRAAALLGVNQVSDIIEVISPDTFRRPIYAGNAIATVQSSDPIKVISVRASAFETAPANGGNAPIVPLNSTYDAALSRFVSAQLAQSERPELTAARVVISGGRGMGNGANFALLEAIADKLGAAIGASRAAVDAGFVPNDMQVGQTGKIVAPELYIAVGISGAIQHLAGMKESKVIVAINQDEDAPIFQVADYGLVADLFEALPALEAAL
ncbi:MAG: FAD-binding protein [Ferrimonas sp.]